MAVWDELLNTGGGGGDIDSSLGGAGNLIFDLNVQELMLFRAIIALLLTL